MLSNFILQGHYFTWSKIFVTSHRISAAHVIDKLIDLSLDNKQVNMKCKIIQVTIILSLYG
jgi:hypothetical protein